MGKATRRVFVGMGLTAVSLAGLGFVACKARDDTASLERLDVLLADLPDPVRIGRACRRVHALAELRFEAVTNVHISDALRVECTESRLAMLKAGIRDEFARREIVLCDRYVLARSEYIVAGLRLESALSPRDVI